MNCHSQEQALSFRSVGEKSECPIRSSQVSRGFGLGHVRSPTSMLPSRGHGSACIYSCKCLMTTSKAVFTCCIFMAEVLFPVERTKSFYGTLERSVSFSANVSLHQRKGLCPSRESLTRVGTGDMWQLHFHTVVLKAPFLCFCHF